MIVQRLTAPLLAAVLVAPLPAFAFYHRDQSRGSRESSGVGQGTSDLTAPSPTPRDPGRGLYTSPVRDPGRGALQPLSQDAGMSRGKLRRPEYAAKLEKVQGIILGMTNKLTNLSDELARHLAKHEERVQHLTAKGFDITVDEELAAARTAIADAQAAISDVLTKLAAIPDSETPRSTVREARGLVYSIRPKVRSARQALYRLRLAVRQDVRASRRDRPSPSPGVEAPTPTPTPTPSPELTLTPSPTPTP